MTAPGALPQRSTVYEAPGIDPAYMTVAQQAQFETAQIANIAAASGAQKISVAEQITLMLLPVLAAMDPYDDSAIQFFADQAARIIELGMQSVGQVAWSAISSQLAAYDVALPGTFERVESQRTTPLEVAYIRPAGAYRRRMAAGVESISGTIEQAEEERFQALGGAEVAAGRKGQSNADIEGTKRSPTKSRAAESKDSKATRGEAGAGSAQAGEAPKRRKADRDVNTTADDWDAEDAAERAEADAAERAAEDEFQAEQELRRQAALSEEEKQVMLEQVAQHEMEVRLERMVNDDLALASRKVSQDAMRRGKVKRYRRVLHPELAKYGESCGLCVAASTRLYSVEKELLPIHNLCNCEPVIVWKDKDPGDQINKDDLGVLYEEAGFSTSGSDLKQQRYTVFDHPELGPVLRNTKHATADIKFSERESTGREKE